MKKQNIFFVFLLVGKVMFSQVPTVSLVGYWPFDGDAHDYSGQGNNGTIYNVTLTCDRCGNPNKAYSFNGTNASIVVNNSSTIDFTNSQDFSVSFWIKTYANPTISGLPISKNLYGSWSGYQFISNNVYDAGYCNTPGQLSFYTASGFQQDACCDKGICSGSGSGSADGDECFNGWYFITGVYDGNLQKNFIYVNSVLQSDIGGISGSLSNSMNLVFGASPSNVLFFKGALDAIRIYKMKLSQNDINALYAEPCITTNTTIATNINEQQQLLQNIQIFPNPAQDNLHINYNKEFFNNSTIELFDMAGRLISHHENTDNINIQNIESGMYLVKFTSGSNEKTFKVMVQH